MMLYASVRIACPMKLFFRVQPNAVMAKAIAVICPGRCIAGNEVIDRMIGKRNFGV